MAVACASAVCAAAQTDFYGSVRAKLRGSAVPVLLPSVVLGQPVAHRQVDGLRFVPVVQRANRNSYEVDIAYDPQCNGANVCSEMEITAERSAAEADVFAQAFAGKRIALARGVIGYFASHPSGASDGGNVVLAFRYRGARYEFSARIYETLAELTASANSALLGSR